MSNLPKVMSLATSQHTGDKIPLKPGLLERRGSSTNLTIELAQPSESPPRLITPTRECTEEEFLLSTRNLLSGAQLKKAIENPVMLHTEFLEVPLNQTETVEISGSGVKNRYPKVLPNPQTRVILPNFSDDPLASYINANYIRGYDGENHKFIATQGPLINTVEDFWRMIWAERVPAIVMITNMCEEKKTKCEEYFPFNMDRPQFFGSFSVTVRSIDERDDYTIRAIEIKHERETRPLQHYWYVSWPDHGIPKAADAIVSLAAEVNSLPGPVVVHCSAGIGRTGCFIGLAIGMTQLIREGSVDMLGILCQLRYDRGGMIQTAEQYEFVHRALYLFEQTLDSKPSTSTTSIDLE